MLTTAHAAGWQHVTIRVPDFQWPTVRSKYTHVFLSYTLRIAVKMGNASEQVIDIEYELSLILQFASGTY